MSSDEIFIKAKEELLSGKISLRQLSTNMGIDRDILKEIIKNLCTPEEVIKMEKVLTENRASSTRELDDPMKQIVISILKGKLSAREASKLYGIDRETLRRKAEELANSSPEYIKYYINYKSKRGDYSGIDFRRIFIEIIEFNESQTEAAERYGIPTRTMSRELEKIGKSEDEQDRRLYDIAKIHAEKKMKKKEFSESESRLYESILSEIKEKSKFITLNDEELETKKIRELREFKAEVEQLEDRGMNKHQIADEMHIGVSTIRRRLLELEELEELEGLKGKTQDPSQDEPDGRE